MCTGVVTVESGGGYIDPKEAVNSVEYFEGGMQHPRTFVNAASRLQTLVLSISDGFESEHCPCPQIRLRYHGYPLPPMYYPSL